MNTNALIPAFPTWIQNDSMMPGMTLRDYFAALALQALVKGIEPDPQIFAEWAYEFADAMMEARK
jgi:hypothetical protein